MLVAVLGGAASGWAEDPTVTYAHTLTVLAGEGRVVSDPEGIDCGAFCELTEEATFECPEGTCPAEWEADWGTYRLTASGMPAGFEPMWAGCDSVDTNDDCQVYLGADTDVLLAWDDVAAPQVTALEAPARAGATMDVTVSATDNDDITGVAVLVDGTQVASGTAVPFTVTVDTSRLREGKHRLAARVADASGNVSELVSREFTADHRTSLRWSLRSTGVDYHRGAIVSRPFRADADVSPHNLTCSLDGAPPAPCSSPFRPVLPADGAHTYDVFAVDDAGNHASLHYAFVSDRLLPVLTFTAALPAGGFTSGTEVTLPFTQVDANPGVVSCRVDDLPAGPCTGADHHTMQGLADGVHRLTLAVNDRAGNQGHATTAFRVGELPSLPMLLSLQALSRRTHTILTRLNVRDVPTGATVTITCAGRSCPRRRRVVLGQSGKVGFRDFLGHRLDPGTRLRIALAHPEAKPASKTITIRRGRRPLVR